MLTIRDIPIDYPLYNEVLNRHVEQFWHRTPKWATILGQTIGYIEAPIDTTFALHRAGEPFRRLKFGVRVYYPYEAKHLDWHGQPALSAYMQRSVLIEAGYIALSTHLLNASTHLPSGAKRVLPPY